jgi:hypothetical protein
MYINMIVHMTKDIEVDMDMAIEVNMTMDKIMTMDMDDYWIGELGRNEANVRNYVYIDFVVKRKF